MEKLSTYVLATGQAKSKVKIVGRKIDLLHTDLRETFKRVRREQAAAQAKSNIKKLERKTK